MKKERREKMKKDRWILLVGILVVCGCTGWHVGMSGFGGYDHATWDKGPEGKMSKDIAFWMVAGQVRTEKVKLPWGLQPTVEGSYQERRHDFSTPVATQKTQPQIISGLLGVTKEWKHLNGYLLGGVSYSEINLSMYDKDGRHPKSHTGWFPCIGLGLYKPFKIYKNMTISPELKVYVYPYQPGMRRCRDYKMGYVNPFGGIRLEW